MAFTSNDAKFRSSVEGLSGPINHTITLAE